METSAHDWTPNTKTAKRIAGRLLRAHRAGDVRLTTAEQDRCVDGVFLRYVSVRLRRHLWSLWGSEGARVVASGEAGRKRDALDDALDATVISG